MPHAIGFKNQTGCRHRKFSYTVNADITQQQKIYKNFKCFPTYRFSKTTTKNLEKFRQLPQKYKIE